MVCPAIALLCFEKSEPQKKIYSIKAEELKKVFVLSDEEATGIKNPNRFVLDPIYLDENIYKLEIVSHFWSLFWKQEKILKLF